MEMDKRNHALLRWVIRVQLFLMFASFCNFSYGGNQTVSVKHFSARPGYIRAIAGDTIKWIWISGNNVIVPDAIPAGAKSFRGELTASSTSFAYVVAVPGIYRFKSLQHPILVKGKIVVDPAEQRDTEIRIYPQPFQSSLTIDLGNSNGFKKDVTVEVFDALGQSKYKRDPVKRHDVVILDLSALSAGIYMVSLSDGINRKTYKVIKSR
jgi:plastocyanin